MPNSLYEVRLAALRAQLARQDLDGFVVPICDEHMSEYIGHYAQRLQWLTGYDGSAGTAVILRDPVLEPAAAMFVDGRYTLQVRQQVDGELYAYESVPQTSPALWLGQHAPKGARIGFDPWLHTKAWADTAARALAVQSAHLVPVKSNPIDAIWTDQPEPSLAPVAVHPVRYTGRTHAAKRAALARELQNANLDAAVLCALDSIAWLFNIRGSDVDRTPVALAFALLHADGSSELFIDERKITPEVREHLGPDVCILPRDAFVPALEAQSAKRILVDSERSVKAVFSALEATSAHIVEGRDPTVLPRALKNSTERDGHRSAQARDGAAMARFLHWLSVEGPKGTVDELSAAAKLHASREATGCLKDLSFDTISGSGPNGAIVHYRVSPETNRPLAPASVYLVDSGGQYLDGTTDITRTLWIGDTHNSTPDAEICERFTRVLKGHIALAQAIFPQGTVGSQLDILARQYLWNAGLDYAHGTGHGVGSFLSVHEGPQRIGKSGGGQGGTEQQLLPGMILSNEPGYYKAGEYGIRIENLVLVEERTLPHAEGAFMGFETLTFCPIERRLIATALLSADERKWLDTYHAKVLEIVGPLVDSNVLVWLEAQCRPL